MRNPDDVALGSVDDLALSPDTGKLGHLVIARGGIFGFDETRMPIPWDDFNAAPNATLLVRDTTKSVLEVAPKIEKDSFSISGEAGSESQKVDAYWKANQPHKASNLKRKPPRAAPSRHRQSRRVRAPQDKPCACRP